MTDSFRMHSFAKVSPEHWVKEILFFLAKSFKFGFISHYFVLFRTKSYKGSKFRLMQISWESISPNPSFQFKSSQMNPTPEWFGLKRNKSDQVDLTSDRFSSNEIQNVSLTGLEWFQIVGKAFRMTRNSSASFGLNSNSKLSPKAFYELLTRDFYILINITDEGSDLSQSVWLNRLNHFWILKPISPNDEPFYLNYGSIQPRLLLISLIYSII